MRYISLCFLLLLTGCTQGNCIRKSTDKKNISPDAGIETVWVYKYDGSLQCGLGEVISLGEMKSELEDILVYQMEKRSDGLMRTMNCGASTGMANVYQIQKQDLEIAKKLGFELWSFSGD